MTDDDQQPDDGELGPDAVGDDEVEPDGVEPDEVGDVDVDGADSADDEVGAEQEPELDAGLDAGLDELDAELDAELGDVISDEIAQLVSQRDDYLAMAQRVQADFDNYKKQQAMRTSAEVERATGQLAEALLPVLDAAEAAYVGHPDEVGPLLNLLLAELKKHGLEAVDLLGEPFDPNLADAVAHEPGDGGEVVVAEVLRSGYTWKGRTLRPAMVRTRD
jgi:molecular chaperone GrpE